jgi:hypothetical protein
MNWKDIAAAAAMVASITPAMAGDQTVTLTGGGGSFIGTAPLLSGGDDVISFLGLAPGFYQFDFSLSSRNAGITSVMVNSQSSTQVTLGVFQFFGLSSFDNSPFTATILGSGGLNAAYSGEVQATSVPEPESYAMMLAGLVGIVSYARRRRS